VLLAVRVEGAELEQLLAQLPQGELRGADPLREQAVDQELVVAARRVDADAPQGHDFEAVVQFQPRREPQSLRSVQDRFE